MRILVRLGVLVRLEVLVRLGVLETLVRNWGSFEKDLGKL